MPVSNFETELKEYYEAKRRSYLTSQIDEVTALMRETLLLCTVYDVLFEGPLSPESDIREKVQVLRGHVQNSEFDAIEEKLPSTLTDLQSERDSVRSALQKDLHDIEDRIEGFEALNKRIEKLDENRITDLKTDLEALDRVPIADDAAFEELTETVREEAKDFSTELEAVEEALFEEFSGSDIERLVRSLLSGDSLRLDGRDPDELVSLQESRLGPYVNLSLEGELP